MSDQGTQSTAGFTVKRDKCEFGVKEIAYLCHKIGCGCVSIPEEKVEALRSYPKLITQKNLGHP